jgi:predicted DNA-binding transcriptional regulator YafY
MPAPQTLGRHTDVWMLARIHRAIRDGQAIQIAYQSMTDHEPKVRWIAPHALASDGIRWHARAYCFRHQDYRDFVIVRMSLPSERSADRAPGDLPPDREWKNFVELTLVPAESLGSAKAAAIRREYGFKKETFIVYVRQALLFYALRRWGLDRSDSRLSILSQRIVEKV